MSGPEGLHGISNMTVVQRQCGDEIREVLRLAACPGINGPVDHFHLDRFLRIANHLGSRSSKLISEIASRCDASGEKLSCTTRENASPTARGLSRSSTAAGSKRRPADPPKDPSAPRPARSSDARHCAVACLAVVGFRTYSRWRRPRPLTPGGRAAALRHQARHNRAARKSKSQT
jgi:hypothetical protein